MDEQDKILIDKYLENSLNEVERGLFQEKMAQSEDFRQAVESQGKVHVDLQQFFATENLRANIEEVKNQPRPRSLWKKIVGGAGLVGIIVIGIWWGMSHQGKPEAVAVADTITAVSTQKKNQKSPKVAPGVAPKPTINGITSSPKPSSPSRPSGQALYYVAYIPEFIFYSGSAFMGSVPDQQVKRVVKIYRSLPETGLDTKKNYYQFADTLSIYGKTEKNIQGLIYEKSQERFHLLIKPDTFLLEINDPLWRELTP